MNTHYGAGHGITLSQSPKKSYVLVHIIHTTMYINFDITRLYECSHIYRRQYIIYVLLHKNSLIQDARPNDFNAATYT